MRFNADALGAIDPTVSLTRFVARGAMPDGWVAVRPDGAGVSHLLVPVHPEMLDRDEVTA